MSTLVLSDRKTFMHHAYNALFSGEVRTFPTALQTKVVAEITQDLCALVRSFPKEAQDEFLRDVMSQVRTS